MEFTLVYEGQLLGASKNKTRADHKHQIRRQFHPQLKNLWQLRLSHWLTENRSSMLSNKWLAGLPVLQNIANHYSKDGYRFVPLVMPELSLACKLDILFLRREVSPGAIIHGGDIDNRLKTLFDALRMPSTSNELAGNAPAADEDPFYCLLQDDKLITEVNVRTDTLLTPESETGEGQSTVKLIIKVTIRPLHVTEWNTNFA
jgi:hypothetical protein